MKTQQEVWSSVRVMMSWELQRAKYVGVGCKEEGREGGKEGGKEGERREGGKEGGKEGERRREGGRERPAGTAH